MDRYRRTDEEVREVISEVGLERLIAVAHRAFTDLGFPLETRDAFEAALYNGHTVYSK